MHERKWPTFGHRVSFAGKNNVTPDQERRNIARPRGWAGTSRATASFAKQQSPEFIAPGSTMRHQGLGSFPSQFMQLSSFDRVVWIIWRKTLDNASVPWTYFIVDHSFLSIEAPKWPTVSIDDIAFLPKSQPIAEGSTRYPFSCYYLSFDWPSVHVCVEKGLSTQHSFVMDGGLCALDVFILVFGGLLKRVNTLTVASFLLHRQLYANVWII